MKYFRQKYIVKFKMQEKLQKKYVQTLFIITAITIGMRKM